MLIRKLTYEWTCNKCKKTLVKNFAICSLEEIPILSDPPDGWAKFSKSDSSEHWCPECLEQMEFIRLNKGPNKIIWDNPI